MRQQAQPDPQAGPPPALPSLARPACLRRPAGHRPRRLPSPSLRPSPLPWGRSFHPGGTGTAPRHCPGPVLPSEAPSAGLRACPPLSSSYCYVHPKSSGQGHRPGDRSPAPPWGWAATVLHWEGEDGARPELGISRRSVPATEVPTRWHGPRRVGAVTRGRRTVWRDPSLAPSP
ncbi:Ankyrin repeat and KH domain-containing protein 1 [Manis javanica]|nr:Ankyrin repeat and KH domain-containing protein 1 [Manis javanica]